MPEHPNVEILRDKDHQNPYLSLPLKQVHTIKIALLNEDFHVSSHDNGSFFMSGPSLNKKDYQIYIEDHTLYIERNDQHTISKQPYGDGQKLELFIPKNSFYRELNITNTSGEGKIFDLDADKLIIKTKTGPLTIKNIEATHFTLETISGDIELKSLQASNAQIQTTNADCELYNIQVNNALTIKSIEGDIDLEKGHCQELFFETESGDLDCEEFYPNAVHFQSVEGDLDIKNKKTDHDIIIKSKQSIEGELSIK